MNDRHFISFAMMAIALITLEVTPIYSSPPMLRTVCGAVADAEEAVGNSALAAGKAAVDLAMKPIAIVGGLKAAAVGTGMKISGGAIKFVGGKMVKDGAILEATGAGVKGAGLGVAALGLKPVAEKVILAGKGAESTVNAANSFVKSVGDTSVQIGATIDSPIIGHHHKEVSVSAGSDSGSRQANDISKTQDQQLAGQSLETAQQVEQQQSEVKAEEKHSVSKRAAKVDTEVMKSAFNLVKEAKMEDCVARAICDLNCNPQGFGQHGKQVFMNMVRLQGSNVMEQSDSKYFYEAASKGRSYSGKCEQCSTTYEKCKSKSTDLILLASHIKMDST